MNPKEKAQDLFRKIFNLQHVDDRAKMICLSTTKIAKLLCDEIVDTAMTGYLLNDSKVAGFQIKMRDYWIKVKYEIEKI